MRRNLILDVAISLLLARWKQTLVAAVGVTFSITMFVSLLSFMGGLNKLLDNLILNRTPHIRLYNEIKPNADQPVQIFQNEKKNGTHHFISSVKPNNKNQKIRNANAIINSLKKDKRVWGVSPKLTTPIFYNVGATSLNGVVNGIDVESELKLFAFKDYVVKGDPTDIKDIPNSIILGKGLADIMLVDVGDIVQVTSPKGVQVQMKVVGLFQSGIMELDKVQSYASIITAQKLLGVPTDYITDLQVKLHDLTLAPVIAKEFAVIYEVDAVDIQTANSQFETGSSIRTIISYAVGITLLIVAGFGIYNILNMLIYEKMDSIAIMKATGFSGRDVRYVFIYISMLIGFFGAALGLIFGYGLSNVIAHIPFETASLPTVRTYPVDFNPAFYFIGGIFALITTFMAGYFPARKASKIDPVIIIRGK